MGEHRHALTATEEAEIPCRGQGSDPIAPAQTADQDVIPGLGPGIQPSAGTFVCRSKDGGDLGLRGGEATTGMAAEFSAGTSKNKA